MLRVPMDWYFTEPRGMDCYQNTTAFLVISWFVVVINFVVALMCLYASFVLKRRLMKVLFLCNSLIACIAIVFAIGAMYFPKYSFRIYAAACALLMISLSASSRLVLDALLAVVRTVGRQKFNLIQVAGGPVGIFLFGSTMIIAMMMIVGGAITAAVENDRGDNRALLQVWRVHCVGWAVLSFTTLSLIYTATGICAKIVTDIMNNAPCIASWNGVPSSKTNDLRDFITRMEKSRVLLLLLLPLGVGAWVMHAIVLPVFWWIAYLHFLNAVAASQIAFFAFVASKNLPWNRAKEWLKSALGSESSGSPEKSFATSQREGANKSSSAVAAVVSHSGET